MTMPSTRKLAIVLAISIGFNLFLGGAIASAWLVKRQYGDAPPPRAGMAGDFDFRGGLAALGGEARPLAREIRREYAPRLREAGQAMHDARREVGGMLRADEIDTAELDKALAELRKRADEAQMVMHGVLMEAMMNLTPEQRRIFLKAAMQRGPRGDRRPPLGRPEGPPPGG
jgi:uncharacterized membrane protein